MGAQAFRAPETLGGELKNGIDYSNSDLYSVGAILLWYACPVSEFEKNHIKMTWEYDDNRMTQRLENSFD